MNVLLNEIQYHKISCSRKIESYFKDDHSPITLLQYGAFLLSKRLTMPVDEIRVHSSTENHVDIKKNNG